MTSYIVSAFSKIGMMAAVVAASLFPTSLSAQDVAGAADAAELALAGETPVLDSGNTAWLIVATVLVLLMSIPGIALFYGGLVRQKNVLSVIMQTMFIVGVVSILWVAFGYSWAFGTGFMESGNPLGAVIGGFDKAFLYGITIDTMMPSGIPELTFVMFQCMFALITPALILGAFAERIKFSGYTVFIVLWVILAYFPMAHWVWGGGFLQRMGAIDFAGGTVVHINAGISALVMAIMLGKREDYRIGHPVIPHNVAFVFMGTSFLWLGWFGFNAGSGCQRFPRDSCRNGRRGGYLDGDGLDMQQEADYRRRVHGSRGRTGGDHSGRRHGRSAGRILYRADYAGRLLFHGGRHQTEVQV